MVVRLRQHGARNQGIKECLIDVYCHWWAQSDGKIQSASRTYQCQTCSDFRPSKRSTRVIETPNTTDFNANDDDTIFESLTLYYMNWVLYLTFNLIDNLIYSNMY